MLLLLALACAPPAPPAPAEPPLPPHTVFASAEEAVRAVLAKRPRVLGVGEVHATTDGPAVPSTISRFTERVLPLLAPETTDLVIETWRLDRACGEQAAAVVETVEIETKRPEQTKSEIVLLAEAALALGVRPHDLVLTCEEYGPLAAADGSVDYDRLLTLLTDKLGIFAQAGLDTPDARVVLYGGAMHNDLFPAEGLEGWSYGEEARAKGGDAYVELDLYQPELLHGKESLIDPAWAPLLERATGPDRAVLFERGPGSYIVFLETVPAEPAPPSTGG